MSIVNALIIVAILILILVFTNKNAKTEKNIKIVFISALTVLFVFSSIQMLRFLNPVFRINYDIKFNNTNEYSAYISGDEYCLPLPKNTVQAYKYSDYGVMYYTKLTYDEFINYYEENGYIVENNNIICDDAKYTLRQNVDYDGKYTAISIETSI